MSKTARKSLKFFLRLMRHPGTPESVGRGVAAGLFMGLLLPAGQMLAAFPMAILLRGARGIAVVTTWIVNPLTIPLIWPIQCYLGSVLIGHPLSHQLILDAVHTRSLKSVGALSRELIVSFFAGGALLGAVVAVIGYFVTTIMVRRHRIRLANRKERRVNRRTSEGTSP